ncbi:apolipoprotein N-acyltransferase [Methylomagnum ishizawai]|uniref:Apolipoprotein N-acyltransferase n=1 Tax=Methylomagnum ishizawai TaxID=1760988 RepID=A0A1Y6D2H5_9GAMM|nr:apolipoprotein N-acyltransferase [Methylomagnum ishizawai]SMF94185.1 apolipoprotein N-acyltransferase [Methylomagnum ishizawai]
MLFDLLALAGGLLLPFAFAPYDQPALAVVALMLLFAAWGRAGPGRAFWRGFLFGLGQFGVGASWVYISMHRFGGASVPEAVGLTALFVLFWSPYPGFVGWLAARLGRGYGPVFKLLVLFPAAYTLADWLRSWLPTGFPWLQVGYSQIDTPLGALAPLFGSYGVGWAVALVAGGALALFRLSGHRRRVAGIGLVLFLGLCAALERVRWTEAAGPPIRVALLQGNVPQNRKWEPQFQREILGLYTRLTRQHWDAQLVIWPETAVPAFYQQVKDTFLADLAAEARQHGTDLLLGIPYYDPAQDRYFNSIVALGGASAFYFKRHLVPLGEYVPWRPLLGWVLDILEIPLSDFGAGRDDQTPLKAAGYPLAASICYEDVFGQESLLGLPTAAYLVNVTNDAWFGDSAAPHQHAQMARMRALETGRWMLRATNSGVTALITDRGRIAATAPLFQEAEVTGSFVPMRGRTPYVLWGDGPVVVGLGLVLGITALRRRWAVPQHPA